MQGMTRTGDVLHVVGEVLGRADDALHLFLGGSLVRPCCDLPGCVVTVPGLAVAFGDVLFLFLVGDDEEVPALAVAAGGGLSCDLQAVLDDLAFDGAVQVEPFTDGAGRGQQVVEDRQVFGCCQVHLVSLRMFCSASQKVLCSLDASPFCSASKRRAISPSISASGSSHRPGNCSLLSRPLSSGCSSS